MPNPSPKTIPPVNPFERPEPRTVLERRDRVHVTRRGHPGVSVCNPDGESRWFAKRLRDVTCVSCLRTLLTWYDGVPEDAHIARKFRAQLEAEMARRAGG